MTDSQIKHLELLLKEVNVRVEFQDGDQIWKVTGLEHNHKDTTDPEETPEPVAWLSNGRCASLWLADPKDFRITPDVAKWPPE